MAARSSRVVMLLAGEEAQRRFNPKSIRKYHAAADHGSVIEVLTRLHLDAEECRCAFRYLLARTRNLISNPWYRRRIEDLAKALIRRARAGRRRRRCVCSSGSDGLWAVFDGMSGSPDRSRSDHRDQPHRIRLFLLCDLIRVENGMAGSFARERSKV
jgi:hypothetical protein